MFSGFYVALLVILVLLIVRVVSFEWREKHDGARWRATWLWANTIGSVGAPFLWGVALANLVAGVPLDSAHVFTGGTLDLFSAYTVTAGIAVVSMFALHGATYLALRAAGDLRERASRTARRLALPAIVLGGGVAAWTVVVAHQHNDRAILPTAVPAVLTATMLILALVLLRTGRDGRAFAATGLGAIGFIATIFTGLYPRVLVSDPSFGNSLTIANAATGHYALEVITGAAVIFAPLILLYQGWTYYALRARLTGHPARPASGRAGQPPAAG
jgi:cytochrome d ubiquinol oxidase subunit II